MKYVKRALAVCVMLAVLGLLIWRAFPSEPGPGAAADAGASPTPSAPSPTPEPVDRARELLDSLTLEEKVWQMIMVFPEDITGSATVTDLETLADALLRCPAGGFCIDGDNIESETQIRTLLSNISHASGIGAFIGVDEEGGKVARLSYALGVTTDFFAMYTYREGGTQTAYANASTIGSDIASFGFNLNFAPVADVWTNPENTVIGERAYSTDAAEAAGLVAAATRGYADAGVIPVLKHFPGHGDTAEDSHFGAAVSYRTLEELRACEFLPFCSGIEAGAGMVMTGHVTLPELDPDAPATLSHGIISGLLRGELGWDGVVITDSFRMDALKDYDEAEAVVAAVEAGCDIILTPWDPEAAAQAILHNVSAARIDESVYRILSLKLDSGIIE